MFVVGVDIDGVLGDLNKAMIPMVHQELGIIVDPNMVDKWDFWVQYMSKGEMLKLMDKCWNEGYVPLQEPDLRDNLNRLRRTGHGKRFQVQINSKRGRKSHAGVMRWLTYHNIPYDSLVFLFHEESKFSYPINILIDDRGKFVEEVQGYPNKAMYLRNQPWNQEVQDFPMNARRVSSVDEAVSRIIARDQIIMPVELRELEETEEVKSEY